MSQATPQVTPQATPQAPDYGLDSPGVVRNLVLGACAGLLFGTLAVARPWPGLLTRSGAISLAVAGFATAALCGALAVWMVWGSKVGKVRGRERLLDLLTWTGTEHVLDVGCGRGLMLIGAARRTPAGRATGVDLWRAEDLAGNRPEATLANARLEGAADRVEVRTADMRQLPFPDASFDVVLSSNAIHNLSVPADRDKAIAEIARVLKPGGRALIVDIRHGRQYAAALRAHGCDDVRRVGSAAASALLAALTMGSLGPATLLGSKA